MPQISLKIFILSRYTYFKLLQLLYLAFLIPVLVRHLTQITASLHSNNFYFQIVPFKKSG